jgi:C-terminal processing protease CtpA/Prc
MLNYGDFFSVDRLIIERNKSGTARTYGKGIMQTTYSFMDGSALKLTTANIYWPDGSTCIHGKGITTTTQNSVEKGVYAIMRAQATLN